MRAALRRAAHQSWDVPVIFDDPLAVQIVGVRNAKTLRRRSPLARNEIFRSTRAFLAARSRFCDESIAAAFVHGVRQYVILGAGLDTFAWRNSQPQLQIFEVDHPATQRWKMAQVAAIGLHPLVAPHFVPVDFERQRLDVTLRTAGWSADEPSFFSCCGVASYLSRDTFMSLLAFVAGCPPGSGIAFDVSTPSSHVSRTERLVRRLVQWKLIAGGEPTRSRYDPAALSNELLLLGFGAVDSLDGAAINARYFAGRSDGLRVGNRSALLLAAVPRGVQAGAEYDERHH
jgi:methyltransferase (TIGR00027 family)